MNSSKFHAVFVVLPVVIFTACTEAPLPDPKAAEPEAQTAPAAGAPKKAAGAAADQRDAQSALSVLHNLRSQCDGAAWVLWHSNNYKKWRKRETPVLSMHYSHSIFDKVPQAPATMPEKLRERFNQIAGTAVETIHSAGKDFSDLSTYINAKDYEDDAFQKGDGLNKRLVDYGKAGHRLTREVESLYADYAESLLAAFAADPKQAALAAQLREDLQAVQALAFEMSKGNDANRAVVETAVADISQRVETRKEFVTNAAKENRSSLESFYVRGMEKDVAVEMRKLLRETKGQPKQWAERFADRPRSAMMQLRYTAFVGMPGDALACLRR